MLAAAGIAIGLLLAWVTQARLPSAETFGVRQTLVLVVLAVAQAVARGRMPGTQGTEWSVFLWALIAVGLVAALVIEGGMLRLVALGIGLNALVVLVNGYMPVVHGAASTVISDPAGFYARATTGTQLTFLGDVVRLGTAEHGIMVSAGDLLVLVGVAAYIVQAARADALSSQVVT